MSPDLSQKSSCSDEESGVSSVHFPVQTGLALPQFLLSLPIVSDVRLGMLYRYRLPRRRLCPLPPPKHRDVRPHHTGPVYQAGTLSGNPISVAAGLATLDLVSEDGFFDSLEDKTRELAEGIEEHAKRVGIPFCAAHVGGMFGMYFTEKVPETYEAVMNCDRERFNRFFHSMLEQGINLAPSAFEAGFVSSAHSEQDIQDTVDAAGEAFKAC